jgi:hypothetical protein
MLARGFINRVCDDSQLMSDALAPAERLTSGPTFALSSTRRLSWANQRHSFKEQINLERQTHKSGGADGGFHRRDNGVSANIARRRSNANNPA